MGSTINKRKLFTLRTKHHSWRNYVQSRD